MISAEQFVEAARRYGYQWYAGVPCSFITPFINYVIEDDNLTYVSSSNEGDALAACAGAVIGGQRAVVMMQNSGLGNAINPLTSLAHVFRIPVLIICTLRGDPELEDEPQHQLMGRITGNLFETMTVPWEFFPMDPERIEAVLRRVNVYTTSEHRPYALVMRKDTVLPHNLKKHTTITSRKAAPKSSRRSFFTKNAGQFLTRSQVLERIIELTPEQDTVVVATTGYTGRELFALADRRNHIYMVGSMGCASSLGLGLSMTRPDLRIVVIDGDGAALMRMGNFATIGAYGGANLTHLVLDNEAHDSTGGQATVSAGVSFADVALACGYALALDGNDLALVDSLLAREAAHGPRFGHLKIQTGTRPNLPRPALTPEAICQRLMQHIGGARPT
ncbi:MAG: phosphonopyruvate decarboxylase [Gammaproteobacteria bacterium]|nr:phosphonopyruvate decarboxylase [Gammaproteobacteria bacterium]